MKNNYSIYSGWWCSNEKETNSAGINKLEFYEIWKRSITRNTRADKVFIINSGSKDKPNDDFISWINFEVNSGHSGTENHLGIFCGWTRGVLMALQHFLLSDDTKEYFVYVEQDCLLKGNNIIDFTIDSIKANRIIVGHPYRSGHPLQQSFFIIPRAKAKIFLVRLFNFTIKDHYLSPERKFAIASSSFLYTFIPKLFFRINKPNDLNTLSKVKIIVYSILLKIFKNYEYLPFGYGGYSSRSELDFNEPYLYFQHGSKSDIQAYLKVIDDEK